MGWMGRRWLGSVCVLPVFNVPCFIDVTQKCGPLPMLIREYHGQNLRISSSV